uniref:centrosomal protein of 170 kDa n=1 Tax=Maylandia zebra TaxID=106582 RepID=UPI000D31000B|nr:centrosomal protein of 170 kDa [Maylandia zebra]XP_023010198.2 centrosomal protein of 170 kDa [Maylandia zebra]
MSLTSWFLVSGGGTRHRLPREMIFVGRDDCELMLQSRSVDKQHAVINYEPNTDEHKVKDLGSLNGTFVNDVRIQEQIYVTLKIDDKLRFGYDTNLFTVVRGEMHIPEEALKHEKFSSQLQLNQKKLPEVESSKSQVKPPEAAAAQVCEGATAKPSEANRSEDKATGDVTVLHRGTPLYGQPAWWGDGDTEDQHPGKSEDKSSDRKREKVEAESKKSEEIPKCTLQTASNQEPSYFEIPTKDAKDPSGSKVSSESISREQEGGASAAAEPAHGHASFTIEFDPGASGKVTVKDRVAKVGPETRPRPKRAVGEELSPLQTAMVAAEVKVADWLAQNELPLALKETVAEDDGESVKSDVPVQLRSLKGSKHEDGTQSDSENALGEQRRDAALEERSWGLWGSTGMKIREGRANVPEGLFAEEDSPARRRKPSTSKVAERRRGSAPHQQSGRDECYHHGDDYSDRGTYTIELENGDHEEEEARKLIDKVFGVDQESGSRVGSADQRERLASQRSGTGDRGKPGRMETEVLSEELMVGGPRWVSQWATLAASHIRTDPEGSGGESHILVTEDRADISESSHSASFASTGYTERKRRTLPQLPGEDLSLGRRTPGSGLRADMGEKQDTELQEKENQEEKVGRGKTRPGQCTGGVGSHSGSPSRSSPAKSQDSGGGRSSQSGVLTKLPPRPMTSGEKRMEEVRRRKKEEEKARESSGKPLLRQESFTVEKPSSNVPIELIPRIDGLTGKTQSREPGIDSATLQKDSEAVAAFLETTVSDQGDPPSQSIEGSMSPESDVDTTSTVSQADGARKVVQKRRTLAGQQKEKTVVCSSGKGPAGGRETQDKRVKNRTSGPSQPNRPWTSLDLTDDDVNSNSLLSDSQPTSTKDSKNSHARGQTGSTTVGASTKSSRAKISQAPASASASKATSVPKPRPTRASLLRRARLGDSSDTEPADLDRMSVASEASTASSTSKTGMAKRGMSRIEALAQPRRPRVGSPSAQSDSEATVTRSRGLGARGAGDYGIRQGLRGSNMTSMPGPRARANSASKLPDKSKGTSSHATPASGTRWRRVPVEYASTSEDEYGSNRHISKQGHTRLFPSTRVAQLGGSAPATPNPAGLATVKQHSREQDEYMRDWTAHSEEIARISQDLAKDLAMLAREIHDVAGEIDSVSPAATDPGALLEERVFDDSLDLGGSSTQHNSILGTNGQSVELRSRRSSGQSSRSIRRQTWNRDDAVPDNLLLASVTQLSTRIRQSVDRTTCKIRILFKDKERKWDEIETKLQAEHDSLLLKSSNKEISTIIQDLKRVERQLMVIDMMVDPDGTLDALSNLGLTSPLTDQKISPGAQQRAAVLQTEAEASSRTLSSSRPELLSTEPVGSSNHAEVSERDPGLQQSSNSYN